MKLETYLRMTGLPFKIFNLSTKSRSPKGKMPYIEDKGNIMGDSNFIIDYFISEYGDILDKNLSASEKAVSHAMAKMMEENLYWAVAHTRWFFPENWEKTRKGYFGSLPAFLQPFVPNMVRDMMKKQMYGHGLGRHTTEEIMKIGLKDLAALSDFLADKPFFMGEEPSTLDAIAYSFLANILYVPIESPLKEFVKSKANLVGYCEMMKEKFYRKVS
jgi:glutathione S-transferase